MKLSRGKKRVQGGIGFLTEGHLKATGTVLFHGLSERGSNRKGDSPGQGERPATWVRRWGPPRAGKTKNSNRKTETA